MQKFLLTNMITYKFLINRELFERAVHLKLFSKRMKFFFKRYLTFEEQYGNEATVLAVKEKALAYVKSVT